MVDFSKLLDVNVDDVKPPPALPAGTYFANITQTKFDESSKNKTPFLRVTVKFESAGEDIDPESLSDINLSEKTLTKDYWLTPNSLYRLKNMLTSVLEPHGIQVAGRKMDEMVPELNNMPVMVEVTQRPGETAEDPPRNDIKDIAGVQA